MDIFAHFDRVEFLRFEVIAAPMPPSFPFMDCISSADEIETCADFANPKPIGFDSVILHVRLARLEIGHTGLTPFRDLIYLEMPIDLSSADIEGWPRLNNANCTRASTASTDGKQGCLYAAQDWLWAVAGVSVSCQNRFACFESTIDSERAQSEITNERCDRTAYIKLKRVMSFGEVDD